MRHTSRAALAALLAVTLLVAPARATDGEGEPGTEAGPRKLILYATCAASVFASTTPSALIIAIGSCMKAVLDEIDHAG